MPCCEERVAGDLLIATNDTFPTTQLPPEQLAKLRARDKRRLASGEPIEGPPWVKVGNRYYYWESDLLRWSAEARRAKFEAGVQELAKQYLGAAIDEAAITRILP